MRDPCMRWLAPLPALVAGPALGETFLSVEQAQALLFPGEAMARQKVALTAAQATAIEAASGKKVRELQPKLWRAASGGWFFVDQVIGKHELITYALGIDAEGRVRGIEVLDYRETYGGEVRKPAWRAQFTGKRAGAPLKLGQDIANISGATLSCRNLTDGVRRLVATQAELARAP